MLVKNLSELKVRDGLSIKVIKRAKIKNEYNQDTNGKVTTSQPDITNEGQEVSPFPAGDHKASLNRHTRKQQKQDRNNINDPQKKHRLGMVSKNVLLEGLNRFITLSSDVGLISLIHLPHA